MKKTKKIILAISISLVSFVCIMVLLGYSLLNFGPINWDSGACGGGFRTYVSQEYKGSIENVIGHPITEHQREQIAANLKYDGYKMHTYFDDGSKAIKLLCEKKFVFPFSMDYFWSLDEA